VNQVNSQHKIAITNYGLKCISGNTDFALFGAVAGNLVCSKEDPIFEAPTQFGEPTAPIISCPIPELENITEVTERMFECLRYTLLDTLDRLQENKPASFTINDKILIYIITPDTSTDRGILLSKKQWLADLYESHTDFSQCKFHFNQSNISVAKHLQIASEQLLKNQFDVVLLCGVDSMFDEATCEQLGINRRLQTTKNADGIILGEAAACVVLERYSNYPARAIIAAISSHTEQYAGKPHLHSLVGQRNAISECTQKSNIQIDDIDVIIHTTAGERATPMEWYQATQALWPNKLPEAQRVAYQLGEIDRPVLKPRKMPEELNMGLTVGDVGAASVVMGLILACARFEFNYPNVNNCLINEANDYPFRSAIVLLNPKGKDMQQSKTDLNKLKSSASSPSLQLDLNTNRRKKHG